MGFPCSSVSTGSACSAGDLGSIPGLGISPGEGHGNPLQYSCLEKTQGQRSLVGYSPWSHKESDMTELLSTAQHTRVCTYLYRPSQVGIVVKNPPASARDGRDKGSIPESGRSPGGEHSNPLQYSCLENLHGQRSLAGYSPCCCKKSDTIG